MKKVILSLIISFSILVFALVGILICAIMKGGDAISFANATVNLVNTETIPMNQINIVSIEYESDDVTIYFTDSEEVILKEYMTFTPDTNQLATIKTKDNSLYIQGRRWNSNFNFFLGNHYSRADIYLPSSYAGSLSIATSSGNIKSDCNFSLSDFQLASTSGDIEMNEVIAENITVSSSSGTITFKKAEGKRKFSSTSGDILVNGGNGDSMFSASSGTITINKSTGSLSAAASSGDIEIKDSIGSKIIHTSSGTISLLDSSGDINAEASSGDIEIVASDGGGTLKTTSGSIEFTLSQITSNIDINASSGDVTLKIPKNQSFYFQANTSSGDIDTFFDNTLAFSKREDQATGTIGNAPDKEIIITTTSGYIRIEE